MTKQPTPPRRRSAAEVALDQSEARFRQMVEIAPYAVVMVNTKGRIEFVNAEAEIAFGYRRAELLGQFVEMLVPDRFRAAHPELRNAFLAKAQSRPMGKGRILFARRKDGSEFQVEIALNPITSDDSLVVLSSIIDMSDRRQKIIEAAYLAAIVDSSSDAIIGKNLEGIVTSWNAAAEAMFGYTAAEMIGQPITTIIPPARQDEETMILRRIRTGDRIENFETIRRRKDGGEIAISLTVSPIRGPGGEIVGASKIARDITERQRVVDDLRHSEERFRSIFRAVSEGIFIVDAAEGRFIDVNEAGAAMHGYADHELIGSSIGQLSSGEAPYTQSDAQEWHRKAIETGRPQIFEWHSKAQNGKLFWSEVSLHAASISGRQAVLAIVRDVTERRSIEAQLRQAQKMEAIGLLTGGIAHDFNNLLAIIHGNLELIREACVSGSDVHEMASDALRAAARGGALTHQLLAYARQQPLAPKMVDIPELIADMTQMLRRTLGETIEIKTAIPTDLWHVRIDPNQLEHALVNLAVNARDAMRDGGTLTIEAANKVLDSDYSELNPGVAPGFYVQISVSDNGCGIARDVLERVFEPFFTTKPLGQGTGLGLSMVFGFVKQSGGHIKIYSELGHGTSVKLYLPRGANGGEDWDSAAETETQLRCATNETILVVEDDDMVRKFAVRVLTGLGYKTLEAAAGPDALRVLDAPDRIDLLLTDIALPQGMSGIAVAREAQRRRPGIKILYMSGYAKDAVANNGLLDESVHLLSKPFPKAELARTIRDILDGTATP